MQLDTLRTFSDKEIAKAISNKRVIILSPRFRNRNILISSFVTSKTYLYSLLSKENNLFSFLQNLADDLTTSLHIAQSYLSQALAMRQPKVDDLVDALIADLGQSKTKLATFILDQLDNLPISDDSNTFFECLSIKLPTSIQLIINSRVVSFVPWQRMIEQDLAIVLGEDRIPTGGIFAPGSDSRPHLEVFAFGLGTAYMNGIPILRWDGPLVKNLFLFSVDRQSFTRDEIFETFWPSLSTKEATNVWHVTKRKISEQLGYDLLTYSGGFYNLSDQLVLHYDAGQFDELCMAATNADQETSINNCWQAIKLYRSEFLHLSVGIPWIQLRREQRQDNYGNALIQIGRMYESKQQLILAISHYLRALRELPLREDIHRRLIELYIQSDQPDQAMEQYRLLEMMLKKRLNIAPSKETIALYQAIRAEQGI